MSMAWMRMPGRTWSAAAASFLGIWVVMMMEKVQLTFDLSNSEQDKNDRFWRAFRTLQPTERWSTQGHSVTLRRSFGWPSR
jgi:hypothetical protein